MTPSLQRAQLTRSPNGIAWLAQYQPRFLAGMDVASKLKLDKDDSAVKVRKNRKETFSASIRKWLENIEVGRDFTDTEISAEIGCERGSVYKVRTKILKDNDKFIVVNPDRDLGAKERVIYRKVAD